jgi:hypothetical protein
MRIAEERNKELPLVLAVLGDRRFQNLILGILGRRTGKQQEKIGLDNGRITFQTPE